MQKTFHIECIDRTRIYPLGVSFEEEGLRVSAVCEGTEEVGIVLYDRRHRDGVRIPFPGNGRVGSVRAMMLSGYHDKACSYLFYRGEEVYQDPFCKRVCNPYGYGVPKSDLPRCQPVVEAYDWGDDRNMHIPYEEMLIYALHVRGFTRHRSSGVKWKGTYAGVEEKIPYMQELGINMALLMPCYEFDEIMPENTAQTMEQAILSYRQELPSADGQEKKKPRINYWGYQPGLYYVPKSAYAHSKDAAGEFRDMVRAFHKAGIGVAMQFYFPPEMRAVEILDILKYWVLEYHIDGFHLMSASLSMDLIAGEPLLSETMLLTGDGNGRAGDGRTRNRGFLSDGFLYDMRRFIKGDDNMINQFLFHLRENKTEIGIVNSIARWEGFRLADLVSYDRKHNEDNGENNQDGTDYNCSWNCGVEGKSRKKSIQELRLRQMKNAVTILLMSQGTPLLYSGDEFANTQGGNNNPYCQDNDTAWIKWNQTETGRELLAYTKFMISMRKAHRILHSRTLLRGIDTLSCGFPDISFHGREAWRPDTSQASRCMGIMYCGFYAAEGEQEDERFFYIAVNMHWEVDYLGLPKLPKGKLWTYAASTGKEIPEIEETAASSQEICVPARTIVLCTTKDVPVEPEKPGRKKAKKNKGDDRS
ncbi:MAG: hypothetical protein K2K90_19715 [Lachnospiraceae bacterium]|nr:hypothetical protein [Lachnospiraceae bacterium]